MPAVSLCVPTYNRADRLTRMLSALLEALTRHAARERFDVIVSDNGSTDATPQVIAQCSANWPGVALRAIRQERNVGFAGNFAALLAAADGDSFVILADDDRLRPEALDALLEWSAKLGPDRPLAINNSLPGGDAVFRGRRPPESACEIDGPGELLRTLGIFQTSFVSNLLFHTESARREWRPEFARSRYPHSILALRLLARHPAWFAPTRIVDVQLPPDAGDQPLLTSIDMARVMSDHALGDSRCRGLVGSTYRFLVRMVPTAVYQEREGHWLGDAANPYASLRAANVGECYRHSRLYRAAALSLWALARLMPRRLVSALLRVVSRHAR